jgi:hypothetical protein
MKLLTLFVFLTHFSTYAASVKQKDLNFNVKGEDLLKGDVYYSVAVMTKKELIKILPYFLELDTSGFTKSKNSPLLVSKTAYVVNKPIGVFDHQKASSLRYLKHLLGEQRVSEIAERTFAVEIPGSTPQKYKLRTHFDSDDISTTTNSRSIRAITGAKKMDIQVQGASSIIMREMWDYSRGSNGGIHVTAFMTLKENKTLVIDFGLMSLIPPLQARETLESSIEDEASAHQSLINRFRDE